MPAPGISDTALVDVNVWLPLVYDGHLHHLAAVSWFDQEDGKSAAFCRITQLGLLRLLTLV